MIHAIIVDDHELYRLGIRTAIEIRHPDITVVGEAASGAELFDLLKTTAADIVLLDIKMSEMNGVEIARRMKKDYPEIKILAVSSENSTETVQEMLEIGIEGFVSKAQGGADNIVEAVRIVMQGTVYFGRDISGIIHRIYVVKKKTTKVTAEFTEQEKKIIELCHEGLPGKLIADRLGISLRTVDKHKSNIFCKLGINNTLEMVRYALKKGIIQVE